MKNVAVVGCGHWGKNLVRNFHEMDTLTHIYDADPRTLEAVSHQYPGVAVTTDYEILLATPSIDAVGLATPAAQHARMAESALLAGKDVFVEKPLALRYRDGERLVNIAERTNRAIRE